MGVPRGDQALLTQIERDALDDTVPLAATLRKCIALGAQARNADLRDWASQELDGYRDGGVPEYRIIHVPLLIDGLTFTHAVRGQQISATDLPDFAQDVITEELRLAHGVGDLHALTRTARGTGQASVKMSPPGTAELVKLWNYERRSSGQGTIMFLYWDVSVARIDGVLEQIRTTLVRLVSEMRAAMPDDSSVPSPEQAAHAVSVVLRGGKRNQVTVTTAQADNGASANITPPAVQNESGWTRTQTI